MNLLGQRHLQLSQEAVHKTTKVSKTKTDANTNTGAKARETIFKPDDPYHDLRIRGREYVVTPWTHIRRHWG